MTTRRLTPESGWFVLILATTTALGPLGIDTSLPALPAMARALQTSDALVQATLGAFILSFALGQFVVGPLSDRYGRRPIVIGGMALFAAAGLLCALAQNAPLLVAARFVQGFGACAGLVGGRAIIRDCFADRAQAARMQAYASAISGVVPMLAPVLGAALLPLGWRAIYAALVVGGALLAAAAAIWLPETLRQAAGPGAAARIIPDYRRFFALPRSLPICTLLACAFAGLFTFISASPFVLVREDGLSNVAYCVSFAISSGAILIGAYLSGAFAHRIGSERLLGLASAGAAVAGCAMFGLSIGQSHAPAAPLFVGVMATYAFTFGVIVPNAFAAAMEPAGAFAGVAAGTLGATQMLGGAVGSTISGLLPLPTHVAVGLSVGLAGACAAAAYRWSLRSASGPIGSEADAASGATLGPASARG